MTSIPLPLPTLPNNLPADWLTSPATGLQLSLFGELPQTSALSSDSRELTLAERFARFDALIPVVYGELSKMALNDYACGLRRASMQFYFELLRRRYALQTRGDKYKLNNDYCSFYARKMMSEYAHLAGFFELRQVSHD